MMLSKRSKGVSPPGSSPGGMTSVDCLGLLIESSAFPAPDDSVSLRYNRRFRLAGQLLVGQASSRRGRQNFREAASVAIPMLALIVAERLLVEVTEQMERLDADVCAFQAALEQRPEILDPVRMDVALDVLLGVIHKLMDVIFIEAGVGRQFIGEQFRAADHVRPDLFLQGFLLAVRNVFDVDLAGFTIQQADNQLLARSARAGDLHGLLVFVHEAGESADHGFVGFDRTGAAHLLERATLHREADAVEHEPRGFLTDVEIAGYFARTDSVLAIADQPDSGQPLSQRQGRVLENRPDFNAELATVVIHTAFPAALIGQIVNPRAATDRTLHNAIWPAARDHVSDAAILIREVANRISQVLGAVVVAFHAFNLTHGVGLVKSIFALVSVVSHHLIPRGKA